MTRSAPAGDTARDGHRAAGDDRRKPGRVADQPHVRRPAVDDQVAPAGTCRFAVSSRAPPVSGRPARSEKAVGTSRCNSSSVYGPHAGSMRAWARCPRGHHRSARGPAGGRGALEGSTGQGRVEQGGRRQLSGHPVHRLASLQLPPKHPVRHLSQHLELGRSLDRWRFGWLPAQCRNGKGSRQQQDERAGQQQPASAQRGGDRAADVTWRIGRTAGRRQRFCYASDAPGDPADPNRRRSHRAPWPVEDCEPGSALPRYQA